MDYKYKRIAIELMAHARANYDNGWDFLIECKTVDELAHELQRDGLDTFERAKSVYAYIYQIIDEQRSEAKQYGL